MKSFSSYKLLFLLVFFLSITLSVGNLFAQGISTSLNNLDRALNIKITPEFPKPESDFSVSISSSDFDLNSSEVIWSMDGKVIEKGIGLKKLNLKTGTVGDILILNISILTNTGEGLSRNILINPAEINLMWEAETYIPPFYKGKALFTRESSIKVEAFPKFINSGKKSIPKDSLIYEWKRNNKRLSSISGYSKSSIKIPGSVFGDTETIEVSVHTVDNSIFSTEKIEITQSDPKIIFYENHPLFGMIQSKALVDSLKLESEEITIEAVPYFFAYKNKSSDSLEYDWKINNQDIPKTDRKNILTLRREGDKKGASIISLVVSDLERLSYPISKSLRIQFGE